VPLKELPNLPDDLIDQLEEALKRWLPPPPKFTRARTQQHAWSNKDGFAYARAALDGEVAMLRQATKQGRNNQLYRAALKLAKRRNILVEDVVRSTLLAACVANGLLKEDGQRQCNNTISSAFRIARY
jgi:hypothetical protein